MEARALEAGRRPAGGARRRMLALDVGERRIGVAVSEGRIAVPLTIVEHRSRAEDLERVAAIAREQEAGLVVVGLPLLMSGDEGEQARRTRRFGDALARRVAVPVTYQDERFTTVQATEAVTAVPTRRRRRMRVDDHAAAVILQAYIDEQATRPVRERAK